MDIAPYSDAIAKGSELILGLVKRVFPEKMSESEAANLNQAITLALLDGENRKVLAQLAINEAEAGTGQWFIAGWRPAIGWVGAGSLAIYFIPRFAIGTVLWAIQVYHAGQWIAPPDLGIGDLLGLIAPMLGIAALRTYEKKAGVAGEHV